MPPGPPARNTLRTGGIPPVPAAGSAPGARWAVRRERPRSSCRPTCSRESMALTAISSQVEISPLRLACWSPREVRNRNPFSSVLVGYPVPDGEGLAPGESSGSSSRADDVGGEHGPDAESAVLGFSGIHDGLRHGAFHGTLRQAPSAPSSADAPPARLFFDWPPSSRALRLRSRIVAAPRSPRTGSTVSFCWGIRAAAIMSKSLGPLRFEEGRPPGGAGIERD